MASRLGPGRRGPYTGDMIVRQKIPWGGVARTHYCVVGGMLLYASVITVAHEFGWINVNVPAAVPGVLGTALSILLGFRTNSAYNRWWEARKIWGAIVNDSRTLARQVLTLFALPEGAPDGGVAKAEHQRGMVYRQIAFNYQLCRDLRGEDAAADVEGLLPVRERDGLEGQDNSAGWRSRSRSPLAWCSS